MSIHNTCQKSISVVCRAICVFGFLFALAASPANGQQVHQLLYNNSDWADQNLNGGKSMTNGPVAAYLTTPNNQEHAYYLTGDGHVHQLFYNGTSWADEDLTVLSGGPTASGAVAGFSVGNFQYVYYVASRSPLDVHQLLYNNIGWVDTDLTALSGAKTKATATYGMVAFTTSPALHVYYQQYATGDIHQLFSTDGSTWQDQDLTTLTGAVPPSYLWAGLNIGNLQYVYYQDRNYDLHQMNYNNSSWSDTDLTVTAKTPRPLISPVAAFVIPGTKKIRVYFPQSTNSHLLQLASSNGTTWTSSDLTRKTKGPLPQGGASIAAFATTPNNEIHVFYESGNHINQLFQATPTSWANQDLTALTHGGTAVDFSRVAGFSLQNFQYVFYVAQ